jgi:DNA-binding NtrC family response regulator
MPVNAVQKSPQSPAPDIVLLATEWQPRALLRAQLIEEGFEVLATDTWIEMRRLLRPAARPLLAIVDLHGLPDPDRVLNDLATIMTPSRVLVLTAIGTVSPDQIQAHGFRVVRRPIAIGSVVAAVLRAISEEKVSMSQARATAEKS